MEVPDVPDEFLISLKYHNNLPNAPSGPFLKNINILQSLDEFPEFRTSTLEKGYVWQPHFGLDLGVKLDLVDQDAILFQEKNNAAPILDQSDLKYLTSTVEKNRGKTKQIDQSSKPWWLRNTTYMENNLYNVGRVKAIAAESAKEISAKKKDNIDYDVDMLSTSYINDSFDLTARTLARLVAENAKRKVLRDLPVVPMESAELSVPAFLGKNHSLVRFDEDPVVLATEEGYSSSSSTSAPAKRRRVDVGVITNLRQAVKSEHTRNAALEVSLVSPLVQTTSETSNGNFNVKEVRYGWVKDYRMDIQQSKVNDSFLFVYSVGGVSSSGNDDSVQYFPIGSRIDMKKMNPEDSLPHECIVVPE